MFKVVVRVYVLVPFCCHDVGKRVISAKQTNNSKRDNRSIPWGVLSSTRAQHPTKYVNSRGVYCLQGLERWRHLQGGETSGDVYSFVDTTVVSIIC